MEPLLVAKTFSSGNRSKERQQNSQNMHKRIQKAVSSKRKNVVITATGHIAQHVQYEQIAQLRTRHIAKDDVAQAVRATGSSISRTPLLQLLVST